MKGASPESTLGFKPSFPILAEGFRAVLEQPRLIIGGITLLAALIRFFHLGFKPLWYDEAAIYWITRGNLVEVIAQNANANSAPPLFAILLNIISRIGETETVLRALPWLAGTLSIPAMYLLAKQFLSRNVAYLCTLIVGIAGVQVMYSQELREYSMAFLLAALTILLFCWYLNDPSVHHLLSLTMILVLDIFTQYGLALLVASLNAVFIVELVVSAKRRALLIKWIISQVVVMLAVALVYQLALRYQLRPGGFGMSYLADAYWNGSIPSLPRFIAINTIGILDFAFPTRALPPLVLVVGIIYALGQPKGRTLLLLFTVPLLLTLLAACFKLYPYQGGRQDIFLTPMVYILIGSGLEYVLNVDRKRIIFLVVFGILLAGGLYQTYGYLQYPGAENTRPILATLSSSLQPGDRIYVQVRANPAFHYYFRGNQTELIYENPDNLKEQFDDILAKPGRVWIVIAYCMDDECQTIPANASRSRKVELIKADEGARLYLAY